MRNLKFSLLLCTFIALFVGCKQAEKDPILPTEPTVSSAASLTGFSLTAAQNPALTAEVTGTLNGATVTATLPTGTDQTALVASFTLSEGASATIGGVQQVSGETANDFSSDVVYTVTASDGTSANVTVTVTVTSSSAKEITAYSFTATKNSVLTTDVTGTISGTAITLTLPSGTSRAALVPSFTLSDGASLSLGGVVQTTGETAADFRSAVAYTATAADESTQTYTVTVTTAATTTATTTANTATTAATTTATNTTMIAAPANLAAAKGGLGVVSLTWDAVSGATGYKLYWGTATGITSSSTAIDVSSTSYTHTGTTTDSSTRYYKVAAVVAASTGTLSSEVSITPIYSVGGTVISALTLAGTVTTFAGPAAGSTTSGSTDGTGNAARFTYPLSMATDGTNIYLTEQSGCRIRQIVIATQVVTTLAGSTCGDVDGTGTAAKLNRPSGIAYDNGNLYIAEQTNRKVRKLVISTGVVSVFVGPAAGTTTGGDTDGTGNAARFGNLFEIISDGTNLYIADFGNHKIRQAVIATGVVTTFAGPAAGTLTAGGADGVGNAASFNGPAGMASDGTSLYVSEYSGQKIRKIVIATAMVSTVAGPTGGVYTNGDVDGVGSAARFSGPLGLATDGTSLYVGDHGNQKVRKIVISSGTVTTLAGPASGTTTSGDADGTGNAARFKGPAGLVSDGTSLFVSDFTNNKIRRIQ